MPELQYRGPFSKKAAFSSKESHPLLLDLMLIRDMGPEYLGWEPETLWSEIESTYGTKTSELNRSKIQAIRTCHVSDMAYEAWNVFEKIAVSLNNGVPKFDVIQAPSPHACAATLEVMSNIRDKKPSKEVYKYISAILLDDGYSYAPGILEPCNEHLAVYVDPTLQERVQKSIEKKIEPSFDGVRDEDIQIAKSRSILDYVEFDTRKLLKQMEVILRGVE